MLNVFITGASTGIGAALARQYASRGAVVGLVARNRDKLEALADALPGGRDRNIVLPCDVTVREEVFAAAEEFERLSGGTTVVIANAGMSHGVKTEYLEDLDMLEDIYRLNVFAMAYTFHAFIGHMKARGNGQLVGIGSVAGIRGLPGSEAYCASKSAVITYCESLRVEMQKYGIRVSTICPGFVRIGISYKRNDNSRIRSHREIEITIQISHRSIGCSFFNHTGTDDRFACGIFYNTGNFKLVCLQTGSAHIHRRDEEAETQQ